MGAREALTGFWTTRSARERSVLLAGAALVVLAALYATLWDPAMTARGRLSATLPKLRAQLEDMRLQKREIELLRKTLGPVSASADLRALLRAAVERGPFPRAVERIEWRGGDRVVVAAASVGFDQWLDWTRSLQRELGVRVDSCEITALPQPGLVRVEAVFAGAGGRGP
jgi:type II secretory pathway component PulM